MSFKEFIRKQLLIFVVLVTCICFVMGVAGSIFDSDRQFTYGGYFGPIMYAGLYLILQFVFYSKKELTVKQYLFRDFLQLLLYEAIILTYALLISKVSTTVVIALALCVPVVTVLTYTLTWFIDSRRAKEIKKELFAYQQNHLPPKES